MKDLLIVVDYQNDFVDGSLGFPSAKDIYPYILMTIENFKKLGHDVVFTRDTHDENYLTSEEGRHLPIRHCLIASEGIKFYKDLETISSDHKVFTKYTFGSGELFQYLEKHPYRNITLIGLVSHICVISNAVIAKSAQPNAHIIVDTKGIDSFDKTLEEQALNVLKGLHVELR